MVKVKTARHKKAFGKIAAAATEILGIEGEVRVDVTWLSEEEIHALNRETRDVDRPTDVLSYPYIENPVSPFTKGNYPFEFNPRVNAVELGCIAICSEYIEKAAKEDDTVYINDVYRAFTHGILHLMGYDHVTEEEYDEMHATENKIMLKAGLKI